MPSINPTALGGIGAATCRSIRNGLRSVCLPANQILTDGVESPSRRFWLANIYGWPPPQLDAGHETAWLDGLRGVAALLVMTYHYHLEWWLFWLEAPWGAAEDQGWEIWRLPYLRLLFCAGHTQVSIFFVLSGFVLSWSPLGSIHRNNMEKLAHSLGSAAFRRWLRLYLPCFVVGFYSMLEVRWGIANIIAPYHGDFFPQVWDYIKACEKFADPLHIDRAEMEFVHPYNWTMWTIPHEFAGSLLVFLLVLAVARIPSFGRRAAFLGFIAFYAMSKARWTYWLFSTGVLLSDYIRFRGGFEKLSRSTTLPARLCWTAVLILALWLAGVPEHSTFYPATGYEFLDTITPENWMEVEGGGRFWWCWSGIMIITSTCHLTTVRSFFAMSFNRFLGRISYMLYITHRLVYHSIGKPFHNQMSTWLSVKKHNDLLDLDYNAPPEGGAAVLLWLISWLFLLPLALFVAHWCEVLIDGPSVKLAKWVEGKFNNGFLPERKEQGLGDEMVRLTVGPVV